MAIRAIVVPLLLWMLPCSVYGTPIGRSGTTSQEAPIGNDGTREGEAEGGWGEDCAAELQK